MYAKGRGGIRAKRVNIGDSPGWEKIIFECGGGELYVFGPLQNLGGEACRYMEVGNTMLNETSHVERYLNVLTLVQCRNSWDFVLFDAEC
jgi:hypothetical protein